MGVVEPSDLPALDEMRHGTAGLPLGLSVALVQRKAKQTHTSPVCVALPSFVRRHVHRRLPGHLFLISLHLPEQHITGPCCLVITWLLSLACRDHSTFRLS